MKVSFQYLPLGFECLRFGLTQVKQKKMMWGNIPTSRNVLVAFSGVCIVEDWADAGALSQSQVSYSDFTFDSRVVCPSQHSSWNLSCSNWICGISYFTSAMKKQCIFLGKTSKFLYHDFCKSYCFLPSISFQPHSKAKLWIKSYRDFWAPSCCNFCRLQ